MQQLTQLKIDRFERFLTDFKEFYVNKPLENKRKLGRRKEI